MSRIKKKKKSTDEPICKAELVKKKCVDIKEEKGGEMNWEIEINI